MSEIERIPTDRGCVIKFHKSPQPPGAKLPQPEPPKFCEGHPGVEFMKSIGNHLSVDPLGHVIGRLFHSNGRVTETKEVEPLEIEE